MLAMRFSRCCLLLVSLAMISAHPVSAQDAASAATLAAQVKAIAAEHHGDVAVYAENLQTHETVSLSPETPVQTASVIKLAILYEALEQVRAGRAHFSDRITLAAGDQVQGSGLLHLLDAPLTITLHDALTLMVIMSDNSATNLAIDHLGLENIDARIAKLGLKDTYLYKKVFTPVPPGMVMPPDYKRFGLGKTTAHEMATLMTKFVRCELAEPGIPPLAGDQALCDNALKMLHLQFYRSAIPRYLEGMPGAVESSIANKTGSLDAVRNDVAAISTRHGMVVISCFTWNNKDHSWGAEQEGELTIAKIARAIIQAWSPDGLSAWPVAPVSETRKRQPAEAESH